MNAPNQAHTAGDSKIGLRRPTLSRVIDVVCWLDEYLVGRSTVFALWLIIAPLVFSRTCGWLDILRGS